MPVAVVPSIATTTTGIVTSTSSDNVVNNPVTVDTAIEELESTLAVTLSLAPEEDDDEEETEEEEEGVGDEEVEDGDDGGDGVCSICECRYPTDIEEIKYLECCGASLCNGCHIERQRVHAVSRGHIVEGVTPEDEQFRAIASNPWHGCPYCRAKTATTNNEYVERLHVRINKFTDSKAMNILGHAYYAGNLGLPKNISKAEELYQRSYVLDDPTAAWSLFCMYHANYPDQKEKASEFLQRGAILGDVKCIRFSLQRAFESNNYEELARLLIYTDEDAYKAAQDGRKTRERDFAKRFFTRKPQKSIHVPKKKRRRRRWWRW